MHESRKCHSGYRFPKVNLIKQDTIWYLTIVLNTRHTTANVSFGLVVDGLDGDEMAGQYYQKSGVLHLKPKAITIRRVIN
jgi:hypothetical protein